MDLFQIKAQADATVKTFPGLSEPQQAVIEYIAINDAMYRASTAPEAGNAYRKLIEHGQWFNPQKKPSKYRFGEQKQCFRNSFWLARDHDDLQYVEGVAFMGIIPVVHAWCVDADGNVVDVTWRDKDVSSVSYFGIRYHTEKLIAETVKNRVYGMLFR